MSGRWSGHSATTRRDELPADWPKKRRQVIRRDKGICQWHETYWTTEDTTARNSEGVLICGKPGTDVDHIGDKNDHSLDNLQLLCGHHHDHKTGQQGGNSYIPLRRKPERHPALG